MRAEERRRRGAACVHIEAHYVGSMGHAGGGESTYRGNPIDPRGPHRRLGERSVHGGSHHSRQHGEEPPLERVFCFVVVQHFTVSLFWGSRSLSLLKCGGTAAWVVSFPTARGRTQSTASLFGGRKAVPARRKLLSLSCLMSLPPLYGIWLLQEGVAVCTRVLCQHVLAPPLPYTLRKDVRRE